MPKPSQYNLSTSVTDDDWIIIVKNNVTYKVRLSRIKQYFSPPSTIADRLNDIPPGTVATGEVVLVGPFAAVNETTYTKSGDGDWWDVTGFNTGVDKVEFRDNNGTTQVRYYGPPPPAGPEDPQWYDVSFAQRPGFGENSGYTVVMESRYMPDHDAAWYSSTAIDNAISG